ncbi:MAG: hypothetical protein M3323_08670 [Actinomycetota bacterium]|nr:hypothetical protein [Actinomycetota bacterium]
MDTKREMEHLTDQLAQGKLTSSEYKAKVHDLIKAVRTKSSEDAQEAKNSKLEAVRVTSAVFRDHIASAARQGRAL